MMTILLQKNTPVWLTALAIILAGCSQVRHESPAVLAQRTNEQGEVIQQILRERTLRTKPVLLAPDGPTHSPQYLDKYFIQEANGAKREIPTTNDEAFSYCGSFSPVKDSSLWVGVGINPVGNQNSGHPAVIDGTRLLSHNENDLHIVVFDEKRIVVHRVFSVVPKWESSEDEFMLSEYNRVVVFRSPQGFKKYDVVTDAIIDSKHE